jgi:hypothetical protein
MPERRRTSISQIRGHLVPDNLRSRGGRVKVRKFAGGRKLSGGRSRAAARERLARAIPDGWRSCQHVMGTAPQAMDARRRGSEAPVLSEWEGRCLGAADATGT